MKQFSEFKFWFKFKCKNTWIILNKENDFEHIGEISTSGTVIIYDCNISIFDIDNVQISKDWDDYKLRPEYLVGNKVEIDGSPVKLVIESYSNLIKGILYCRALEASLDPDDNENYVTKVLSWIQSTDFYDAPASTRYHEAFKHGLLYHTLTVYNNMLEVFEIPKFKNNCSIVSASLCCLVHDWCKIGQYETYLRNVKNDDTGVWTKVEAFRYKDSIHPFGHGVTSMYVAMKLFKLTEEEALAIRFHMGHWYISDGEVNDLQLANEKFPLVHLIQFADQLSIVSY